jgi:hypothetical protein
MDVGFVQNATYSLPRTADIKGMAVGNPFPPNTQIPAGFGKESKLSETVRQEVMMNLKEVQNFLYMLIGSDLRLRSDNESSGISVNTAA